MSGGHLRMLVDRAQVAAALPGYELGAGLGAGAFGLVLAGRHRRLNRDVAIKVLSAGQEGAPAGFAAEAQILASMDHPHVVRVYDYVETDGLCLIVMELLAGGTLTRRRAGMAAEGACAVGLAVAEALTCAHAQGVLHRDIKPDNILFDTAGLVKVTDFGIAKIVAGSAATASAIIGTPKYMAPEQLVGGRLGPATDLYTLGVVLYELLAGAPLFDPTLPPHALYHHHLHTTPPPLPGVPAGVAEVVLRVLAKDPATRYPSAHTFACDLAGAAARSYGPRWTARSGILLRLSDEVRAAGERSADPVTVRTPSPGAVCPAAGTTPRSGELPTHPAGGQPPDGATGGQSAPGPLGRILGGPRRRRISAAVLLLLAVTGTLFAVRSARSETSAYPPAPATSARQAPAGNPRPLGPPLTGHTDWVPSVAFSPDG
ncbi:serine/threonine-protein kinase, partial [Candidatus Protofrankia californiensis]|uniref:serine/threonine-protein kinase n=1 Tax=Candidatus Protofrankia californiensis TaxID=1839754 RepID=UPI001F495476